MFNLTTVVGLILLAILIVVIISDKIYLSIAYTLCPIIACLVLGFSITETVEIFSGSVTSTMTGLLLQLVFIMPLYRIFAESGLFDVIAYYLIRLTKGNTAAIYIVSYFVSLLGYVGGSISGCYIMAFGALGPVYKRMNLDSKFLFLTCGMSLGTLGSLPWNSVMMLYCSTAGADVNTTFMKLIPFMVLIFLGSIGLCAFLGMRQMKSVSEPFDVATLQHPREATDKPLYRLKFFWVNFVLFVGVTVAVLVYKTAPAWVIFMVFTFVAALINYPSTKDARQIFSAVGPIYYNVVLIFLPIAIFTGVMTGTGIINNFVEIILAIVPSFLSKYLFLVLALISIPAMQFIPYQFFLAMLPLITGVCGAYGVPPEYVAAPFIGVMGLSTSCSPVVSTTYLGTNLAGCEIKDYQKYAFPKNGIMGMIVLVLIWISGWLAV